jgi:DNA-binding PadR family transcriptional regulator
MRTTPVLSDLELALLGLIREESRSGYALRKVPPLGSFSNSPGAVYPALRRMRAAGLIEAGEAASGRRTEVFRITPAGRRALRAALDNPVTEGESHDRLMLRFAFMDLELDHASIDRFLRNYREMVEERAIRLRGERAMMLPSTAALAVDHEIEINVARGKWAERAMKELQRARRPPSS